MKILACLLVLLSSVSVARAEEPPAPRPRLQQRGRAAEPPPRVRLAPQFAPGQLLRYQMEFRTTTESRRTGLIEDPQAASQLEISWGAVVRVEVLGVQPDSSGREGRRTRLRTTYEKSVATVRSDTFNPEGAGIEEQYRKLEGRAIQFTLDAQGKVSEVEGLQDALADEKAASAVRQWLGQLAMGASAPNEGVVPGQKWSAEQPTASAPIAGTLWRAESTYLRDERCRTAAGLAASATDSLSGETCAVILTRFEMTQPRPLRDPTPEDYRKRGLRTAGKWSESGESLSYVSLRTGWVVSITQSGTQEMDVTVSTADAESSIRYAGRVRSQSQITLLPESTFQR